MKTQVPMANEIYSDIALAVTFSGVLYAAISLFASSAALRAKKRVHNLIVDEAKSDPELERLREQATGNVLMTRAEIEAARGKIASALEKLPSEKDRDLVRQGIEQANSAGVAGYVNDVLRKR